MSDQAAKPANVPINVTTQVSVSCGDSPKKDDSPKKEDSSKPSTPPSKQPAAGEAVVKFALAITIPIAFTLAFYLIPNGNGSEETKAPNKLPPPIAFSATDYTSNYNGYTVLVDSFAIASKTNAYYLAGQLRAAQTKSFIVLRPNQQLYVCVGNNKTRRQAERIRDYLNSRYEVGAVVLEPETKQQSEE